MDEARVVYLTEQEMELALDRDLITQEAFNEFVELQLSLPTYEHKRDVPQEQRDELIVAWDKMLRRAAEYHGKKVYGECAE